MWVTSFRAALFAAAATYCSGVSLPPATAAGEPDVGVGVAGGVAGGGKGDFDFSHIHRSLSGATAAIATERNFRDCGEVIDVVPAGDPFNPAGGEVNTLNYGINALIQGLGAFFSNPAFPITYDDYYGIFLEAVGRSTADASQIYTARYGVKVVKVCGRCGDYRPSDMFRKAAYADYCGRQVYGRDATFSGVALIPVDAGGNPLAGAMKGAISSSSIQTDGFQTASVKWPSSEDGGVGAMARLSPGLFVNYVPAMMAAGRGEFVGLIMDNMGFGESSDCFKTPFVKKGYQTSVLPLWLATQDLVADMSDCATELVDKVVINGQSEGGFGTLAIAEALDDIGIEIILAQPGTPADIDAASSQFVDQIIESTLSQRFSYAFAMIGSAYSSSRPDLPNYGIGGQNFLSDDSSPRIVNWANANLEIPDLRVLVNAFLGIPPAPSSTPYSPPLNMEGVNPMVIASVNTTGLTCQDPIGYDLEKLCEAVGENQVLDALPDIRYPVEICHSPSDDLIPFNFEAYATANPDRVSLKPPLAEWQRIASNPPPTNVYTHETALAPCLTMQGWTIVDDTTVAVMSGECKGASRESSSNSMSSQSKRSSSKSSKSQKSKKGGTKSSKSSKVSMKSGSGTKSSKSKGSVKSGSGTKSSKSKGSGRRLR